MVTALIAALLAVPSVPYDWRNVEIVGGGFVTGIIPHPKEDGLVYARTDIGGAYRWNPESRRWVPLMDWITRPDWNLYGVESLGIDPNDPDRLYVAAGTYDNSWGHPGAMLVSGDRGETWTRVDLPFKNGGNMPGRSIGERIAVSPVDGNVVLFGTRNSGLWRSADRGRTWARLESFPQIVAAYDAPVEGAGWDRPLPEGHGVGWVLFNQEAIYAGVVRLEDNLFRSTDNGASWHPVPGQPKGLIPHQAKVGPDGTITLAYCDAVGPNGVADGAVWQFTPRTETWREITPEQPGEGNTFGYGGVAVHPSDSKTIMVSTLCRWSRGDTVFRTTDGGETWVSLRERSHVDADVSPYLKWGRPEAEFGHWIGDVEIDPFDPDRVWFVTGATIPSTDHVTRADRGETVTWVPLAEGLEETAVIDLVSPPVGAHVISALGDIAGFAHMDLTRSPATGLWTNPSWPSTTDVDFAGLRPNLVVRVSERQGAERAAISEDGGVTWEPLPSNPTPAPAGDSMAISADGDVVVWASGGAVYRSLDRGKTWTKSDGPAKGRVVADKVDPMRFVVLDSATGELYWSIDGARSFAAADTKLPEDVGKHSAVFGRPGHFWIPAPDGLYRTEDGGQSLIRIDTVESTHRVAFGKAADQASYPTVFIIGVVKGVVGVFRSTDMGQTWLRINDERTGFGTMGELEGDPKRFGRVYVGTNGRGILVADPKP